MPTIDPQWQIVVERSLQEFLVWARQQPKGVTFGSAGVGTTPQLGVHQWEQRVEIVASARPRVQQHSRGF